MKQQTYICLVAIIIFISLFSYFTYREDVKKEFASMNYKNTYLQEFIKPNEIDDSDKIPNWYVTKIAVEYENVENDISSELNSIIASKEFNNYLFKLIKRSETASMAIFSQNNDVLTDINDEVFLSNLYFSNMENGRHIIITKGSTIKSSKLLQTAVQKAITDYIKNAKNALLSIPYVKKQYSQINLLNQKLIELRNRISNDESSKIRSLEEVSLRAEIKLHKYDNSELQRILDQVQSLDKTAKFSESLSNEYIKSYGKIFEYQSLLHQINDKIKDTNLTTFMISKLNKNKSELVVMLKNEYEKAIKDLDKSIVKNTNKIHELELKLNSFLKAKEVNIDFLNEGKLFSKISTTLAKIKMQYEDRLRLWNDAKDSVFFVIE